MPENTAPSFPIPGKLIPLPDVPKLDWLPDRDGKRVHVQSVYNWTRRGVNGVTLKSLQVGGTRCTTEQWLIEFFERISMPKPPHPAVTPRQAEKSHTRSVERLIRLGIRKPASRLAQDRSDPAGISPADE